MEEWRPVIGWPYAISSLGRVWSFHSQRVLLPKRNHAYGYLRITLCDSPRQKEAQISRLVATAFLRPPTPGEEADHIDEVTSNNRADNLRWLTVAKNRARRTIPKGEERENAKLTASRVKRIRKTDNSAMDNIFAKQFGCSRETVRDARIHKRWRHVQ